MRPPGRDFDLEAFDTMCGIAGLWAPQIDPAERATLVQRMLERLRHRGPDGSAIWQDGEVTLGLMRLAIVAPHTPATVPGSEAGHIHAVLNGEIYNHRQLREDLAARGHVVPEGADTLTVPHLYEEHGAAFPERIDGQFALAVWDARLRQLTLARDRAGEKPLFTLESPRAFAFASEPGALAILPWYAFEPDAPSLARYLVHGFFAGEDCAFGGIRQLPPAHVLEVSERGFRATRYWRPWDGLVARRSRRAATEGDVPGTGHHAAPAPGNAPAATREALAVAVASRLPADVPFGVFLSGGVDSGLVATLAARAVEKQFPTFSLRFGERGYDESPLARQVAEAIGSDHHEITMDAAAGEEALEQVADALQQPLGDPSTLPTWTLAREAAKQVPVVLTGEGGDELFAGYPTYLGHRYASRAARLPAFLRRAIISGARAVRPRHHHLTIPYFIERFMESTSMPPFERHVAWFGTARPDEALALMAPALRDLAGGRIALGHVDRVRESLEQVPLGDLDENPALAAYQILDFELYLGGGLLTKVDRCTMDHGMEARAPFLQPDLIHFALSLRERDRLRGRTGKWALKEAARAEAPSSPAACARLAKATVSKK
jgi:asparagine synthase (glutamine-hydrolysing)